MSIRVSTVIAVVTFLFLGGCGGKEEVCYGHVDPSDMSARFVTADGEKRIVAVAQVGRCPSGPMDGASGFAADAGAHLLWTGATADSVLVRLGRTWNANEQDGGPPAGMRNLTCTFEISADDGRSATLTLPLPISGPRYHCGDNSDCCSEGTPFYTVGLFGQVEVSFDGLAPDAGLDEAL